MSQQIKIKNFSPNNVLEATTLDSDVLASATSLSVANNSNIATNSHVVIGALGSDGAELVTVSESSGSTSLTVSALARAHSRFSQVTRLYGKQAKIYRASNIDGTIPSDASFSELITIDLLIDKNETLYTDSSGGSDYWYKITYYNSDADTETPLSNSVAVRGGTSNQYATIDDIRKEAGLRNNTNILDSDVSASRTQAEAEINQKLSGIYTLPFTSPINPTINRVCSLLASGFLLLSHHGPMSRSSTANGKAKLEEGRNILEQLNTKELVLVDSTGTDISIPGSASGVSGFPRSTINTDLDGNRVGDRAFRMSERY